MIYIYKCLTKFPFSKFKIMHKLKQVFDMCVRIYNTTPMEAMLLFIGALCKYTQIHLSDENARNYS